jgi:hypothetical protein
MCDKIKNISGRISVQEKYDEKRRQKTSLHCHFKENKKELKKCKNLLSLWACIDLMSSLKHCGLLLSQRSYSIFRNLYRVPGLQPSYSLYSFLS